MRTNPPPQPQQIKHLLNAHKHDWKQLAQLSRREPQAFEEALAQGFSHAPDASFKQFLQSFQQGGLGNAVRVHANRTISSIDQLDTGGQPYKSKLLEDLDKEPDEQSPMQGERVDILERPGYRYFLCMIEFGGGVVGILTGTPAGFAFAAGMYVSMIRDGCIY